MPKRKIQVMVDEDVYLTVEKFAHTTNQSLSAVVADYLVMAQPTLEKMTAAMSGFKAMTESQKKVFVENLEESEELAREAAQEVLMGMNAAFNTTDPRQLVIAGVSVSELGNNKRQAPVTNRGATMPKQKPLKPNTGKASKPISSRSKKVKI
jgi:hypothetical protein